MKILTLVLISLLSFTAGADELGIHFVLQDKDQRYNFSVKEINQALSINSKLKFSISKDSAIVLRAYMWGFHPDSFGGANYRYLFIGKSRNPKNKRVIKHDGGGGWAKLPLFEETSSENEFLKGDEGLWDFTVTITDLVTRHEVVQNIKGVEVTK